MIAHPIPPVFDEHSRVLVLGSFPSVASRESGFFYGHPQNRFWRVLAALWNAPVPADIPAKKAFLLNHGVALWDVAAACEIAGSSDAAIRSVTPNDLSVILTAAPVRAVFLNGATAGALYRRYLAGTVDLPAAVLPSTSPANAAWRLPRLLDAWRPVRDCAEKFCETP